MNVYITKPTLYSLFILVFMGASIPAFSQFDRLKDRIERRATRQIENKIERKADEAVDKAIDKIFEAAEDQDKEKKEKKSTEPSSTSIDTTNSSVTITSEDENQKVTVELEESEENPDIEASEFVGSFVMVTEEYKNGKLKDDYPSKVGWHIRKYDFAVEPDNQENPEMETVMIYDRRTKKITTKTSDDDGKRATVVKMPKISLNVETDEVQTEDFELTATGRTKKIEGYLCKEYRAESEEAISYIWIAENFPINYGDLFGFVNVKSSGQSGFVNYSEIYQLDGSPLESTTEKKNSNEKSHWIITDLQTGSNDDIFSLDGYEVKDLSDLFNFKK